MLRILRHLAYEAPHHLTTHQPDTDRCERPAGPAADSTPAPTAPTPCGAPLRSGTTCQRLVCRFHHGTDPVRARP